MELLLGLLKYGFVVALAVEALIVGGALVRLAREKARAAAQPAPAQE